MLQIIAAIMARKGYKTAAWVMFWIAAVLSILSIMSAYGNQKHTRLVYGYSSGNSTLGLGAALTIILDVVVFFVIYSSDSNGVKKEGKTREFSMKTVEELVKTYPKKEHFAYLGSDDPSLLMESLNTVARYLGGYCDNSLHGANLLVDNFVFVYDFLQNNQQDEKEAERALQREYNYGLEEVYVSRLVSYVKSRCFSD